MQNANLAQLRRLQRRKARHHNPGNRQNSQSCNKCVCERGDFESHTKLEYFQVCWGMSAGTSESQFRQLHCTVLKWSNRRGDCSPEPLTEPDFWVTHPALQINHLQTRKVVRWASGQFRSCQRRSKFIKRWANQTLGCVLCTPMLAFRFQ